MKYVTLLLFLLPAVAFLFFMQPVFLKGYIPIPADTIVGLYNPYRDFYAAEYPRGMPFKNAAITDPVRQQYPWKDLSINLLKSWQLPLWDPYNFSGYPLLANLQSAPFYPLNIVFLVLPFVVGWSIFILLQPVLAGIFMFLYLRNLKLQTFSCVMGAVAFAFCGFFVSWMEWGNVVNTGLWLPLLLLSLDKIFVEKIIKKFSLFNFEFSIWHLIFLFAIVSAFLAGHLQVFFYECVVIFAYFLMRWLQDNRSWRKLTVFIFIALLFLAIVAIQLLPLIQFIGYSGRDLDQVSTRTPGWFVPYQNLTQFIAPDFFGNPATLNYWGIFNYGEFIGYIGIIPLVFALYAMLLRKRKIVWFFTLALLLSLLLALPTIFAKVPFKFSFPFISTSQPTRLIYIADFSLSVLCAFGIEFFYKDKKKIFFPLAFIGLLLISFWGFVLFNHNLPAVLHTNATNLFVTKNNLKLPSLLYAVSFILFLTIVGIKSKKIQEYLLICLLIITLFDLYRFTTKYTPFVSTHYLFPQTKILTFLQKQQGQFRVMETNSQILPPNFSIMYKIQSVDGYDPLFLKRYGELIATTSRNQPNISPPFYFNRIITPQNSGSRLINLLNVKYVLSLNQLQDPGLKKVFQEGQTIVYRNKNVLSRVFFVENTKVFSTDQSTINALFDPGLDFHFTATITDTHANNLQNGLWKIGTSTIQQYSANQVTITTQNPGKGFLVFTDSFYPTWHATIDGKETKIYITDYNFRGIVVPPGNHKIIFTDSLL